MIKFRLGIKNKQNQVFVPSEAVAEIVYVFRHYNGSASVWVYLPADVKGSNYAATPEGALIGELVPARTAGRLAYFPLTRELLGHLESHAEPYDIAWRVPSRDTTTAGSGKESLLDYASKSDADLGVIRAIAWYAAVSGQIEQRQLKEILGCTFAELSGAFDRCAKRGIDRDVRLLKELQDAVLRRGLVFLLGGYRSGRSTLLTQYQEWLPMRDSTGLRVSAHFERSKFEEISAILESVSPDLVSAKKGPGAQRELTAIFITLGYACYQSLLDSRMTDDATLSAFMPPDAEEKPWTFVIQYIAHRSRFCGGGGHKDLHIEPFLAFLSAMMKAARADATLTVVLSNPQLFRWLSGTRESGEFLRIASELWRCLAAFARDNYDSSGNVKAKSFIGRSGGQIGIIVEAQRLSLSEMPEGFVRHSVLLVPPFDQEELRDICVKRVGLLASRLFFDVLREATSGAPWFTNFVLDCMELLSSNMRDPIAELQSACEAARHIISGDPLPGFQAAKAQSLVDSWRRFRADLNGIPVEVRLDTTILATVDEAAHKRTEFAKTSMLDEWVGSGLIWLRGMSDAPTLSALRDFPDARAFKRGTLLVRAAEVLGAAHLQAKAAG